MGTRRGRVRVERGLKRVRVYLGGVPVADSTRVLMVWEKPYYPTYYFPAADVDAGLLVPAGETKRSPSRGTATLHDVVTARATAPKAALVWDAAEIEELAGHVSFVWSAMDHWFEEEEEVYVHARDPSTRIDVLQSSRHVEVLVEGEKVADSHQPRLLFETGLPVRYYLPPTDVRLDLLTPSETRTSCPYKGTATYWSVTVGGETFPDLVWAYPAPFAESAGIAGYLCFYNEKVDLVVDGELQERPRTVFG